MLLLGVKREKGTLCGNVARMRRGEVHIGFRLEHLTDRGRLEDSGVDGSIVLKWVFNF